MISRVAFVASHAKREIEIQRERASEGKPIDWTKIDGLIDAMIEAMPLDKK